MRGIQAEGFGNIAGLFGYVGVLGLTSVAATTVFQRQSQKLSSLNRQLLDSSQRESSLSARLADQLQELSIFGSVVDDSIIGITIADMRKPDAPLIYVNNAFSVITGYSRELAIGYNCRFLQGADTDPAELERIRAALRSGGSYSGELINYRQDGTRFWNRLTLYPIRIGDRDSPDYYVANQVDVTSLKAASVSVIAEPAPLRQAVAQARRALQDAERFSTALRDQLAASADSSTVAAEAYLVADQQAHERVASLIAQLGKLLRQDGNADD